MKTAILPGGKKLEFDDALSDKAVEAAVKAHLGVVDEPDDPAIDIEELLMEFVGVAKGLRTAIVAMTKAHADVSDKIEKLARSNGDVVSGVKDLAKQMTAAMEAQPRALKAFGESVAKAHGEQADAADKMSKRLYDLGLTIAEDRGELKALAAGFQALSATVGSAADDVVKALKAPKTIRTNKEGRPIGVDVE